MPVLATYSTSVSLPSNRIISQPSVEASNDMHTDYWWLIDCETMATSGVATLTGVVGCAIALNVKNTDLSETLVETQAQHITLGSEYTTILADTIKAAEFNLLVDFLDDFSWQQFISLRNKQKVLLLTAPYGAQWYVRIGSDVIPTLINAESVYREVQFMVYQQARP